MLTALWAAGREAKLGRYHLKRIVDAREEEFMRWVHWGGAGWGIRRLLGLQ